jgi:small subunit ribosomal protein S6
MRKFETLLLLSPELSSDARNETIESFGAVIDREGGKVLSIDDWGPRELAYAVKKQNRGYYTRLEYSGPSPIVAELERIIRINDGVFKFITVQLDDDMAVEEEQEA